MSVLGVIDKADLRDDSSLRSFALLARSANDPHVRRVLVEVGNAICSKSPTEADALRSLEAFSDHITGLRIGSTRQEAWDLLASAAAARNRCAQLEDAAQALEYGVRIELLDAIAKKRKR